MGPGVLGLREEAGARSPESEGGGLRPVSLAELTEFAEGLEEVMVPRILGIDGYRSVAVLRPQSPRRKKRQSSGNGEDGTHEAE